MTTGASRAIPTRHLGVRSWTQEVDEHDRREGGRARGCAKCADAGWKARKKRTRPFDTQDPPHFPAPSLTSNEGRKERERKTATTIHSTFYSTNLLRFILYIPFFFSLVFFFYHKFLTAGCGYTQKAYQALNRLSTGRGWS